MGSRCAGRLDGRRLAAADPAAVARLLTRAVAGTAGTVVWLCSA